MSVLMTNISTNTSQSPRVTRSRARSCRFFRAAIRPALVPASRTNTGAQKCVIQRVTKSAAVIFGLTIGSIWFPTMVKSLT